MGAIKVHVLFDFVGMDIPSKLKFGQNVSVQLVKASGTFVNPAVVPADLDERTIV